MKSGNRAFFSPYTMRTNGQVAYLSQHEIRMRQLGLYFFVQHTVHAVACVHG